MINTWGVTHTTTRPSGHRGSSGLVDGRLLKLGEGDDGVINCLVSLAGKQEDDLGE